MNKIWTILTRGKFFDTNVVGRNSSKFVYKKDPDFEDTLNLFVPYRDDVLQAGMADNCIRLLLSSSLRDRALEFDPLNTYEDTDALLPPPGETSTSSFPLIHIVDENAYTDRGDGFLSVLCTPVGDVISTPYGDFPYTVTNELSTSIEVQPGFSFRMQATSPQIQAEPPFTVTWTAAPRTDWARIYKTARAFSFKWEDPELREIYREDIYWVNKLAALLMSAVENSSG